MKTSDLISDNYNLLQSEFHKARPDYGIVGGGYANDVMALAEQAGCSTLLDYGCGKNTLAVELRKGGYDGTIRTYDPCIEEHADPPIGKWDLVVCTDVLEHIEEEYLDNVIDHLRELCGKVFFFVIHTGPAKKILPDGRNAHLIQQTPAWWLDVLAYRLDGGRGHQEERFEIDALFYQGNHLHVAGRPKQWQN